MQKKNFIYLVLAAVLMVSSCVAPTNIAYFQNRLVDHPEQIDKHGGIVIQPKDMLVNNN